MTHAELIARFCQLSWDRGLYVHYCGDARRCEGPGLPDLIIAGPGGVIFREVKSASAPQIRADQKAWLRMLSSSGADVAVWNQADLHSGRVVQQLDRLMTGSRAGRTTALGNAIAQPGS